MAKEAVLFPGQGLSPQEIIGFHNRLVDIDEAVVRKSLSLTQDVLNRVHGKLEFNISSSLADENSPSFGRTAFIQPLVYSLSLISYDMMKPRPDFLAGHSLGEYAAITAAGALRREEGTELVSYRGLHMQEACDQEPSKLVSLPGVSSALVEEMFKTDGVRVAEIALVNAPNLIVVACAAEMAPEVENTAKLWGVAKPVTLTTAGAFHSRFMRIAVGPMTEKLAQYHLDELKIPVVSNFTGEIVEGVYPAQLLLDTFTHPVQWAKSMDTLRNAGVETIVEAGPGRSLTGLGRANDFPREQMRNILDR